MSNQTKNSLNKIHQYVFDVLASQKPKVYNDIMQYLSWMNCGKYISFLKIDVGNDKYLIKDFFLSFALKNEVNISYSFIDNTLKISAHGDKTYNDIVEDKFDEFNAVNIQQGEMIDFVRDVMTLCTRDNKKHGEIVQNKTLNLNVFNKFQLFNMYPLDEMNKLFDDEQIKKDYYNHLDDVYDPEYEF